MVEHVAVEVRRTWHYFVHKDEGVEARTSGYANDAEPAMSQFDSGWGDKCLRLSGEWHITSQNVNWDCPSEKNTLSKRNL